MDCWDQPTIDRVVLVWVCMGRRCPRVFLTRPHLTCLNRLYPHNIQKDRGWGISFTFFYHFWQMTPWQLEVKMLGLEGMNRFLSYRNKTCWTRQRQIFTFFDWTPMRALTNATPPPVRLWHDRFVVFFHVLVSRNVINVRGVKCIWHKQTLPSSKCT